jgi:hypothetical protein
MDVSANIIPRTSASHSLGSSAYRWNTVHAEEYHIGDNILHVGNKNLMFNNTPLFTNRASSTFAVVSAPTFISTPVRTEDLVISEDGTKIIYITSYFETGTSEFRISYNNGATFTTLFSVADYYESYFISNSFENMLVCLSTTIYKSTDYGASWTTHDRPDTYNEPMTIVAADDISQIYLLNTQYGSSYKSTDGGLTWNYMNAEGFAVSAVADLSGNRLITQLDTMAFSSDGGNTWTDATINTTNFVRISSPNLLAASDDCKYVSFLSEDGDIGLFTSSDYGQSYTLNPAVPFTSQTVGAICMSASGQFQYCVLRYGVQSAELYASTDYGATWTIIRSVSTRVDVSLHCSADGTRVIYAERNGTTGFVILETGYLTQYIHYIGDKVSLDISGAIDISGNILPRIDGEHSLGSETNRWKEIWMKSGEDIPAIRTDVKGNVMLNDVAITAYTPPRVSGVLTNKTIEHDGLTILAASRDGQIIVIGGDNEPLYISIDGGTNHNYLDENLRPWIDITISDSGQYMLAATTTDYFVSNNTGASLVARPLTGSSKQIRSIGMSANGAVQMLFYSAIVSGTARRYLVQSTDYGTTWTSAQITHGPYSSIQINQDGSYYLAGGNFGALWGSMKTADGSVIIGTRPELTGDWGPVAVSRSGQYMLAHRKDENAGIWRSADYGLTFTLAHAIDAAITSFEIVDDGMYQIAVIPGQKIYGSADYGESWSQIAETGANAWSSSSDVSGGVMLFINGEQVYSRLALSRIPGYYVNAMSTIVGPTGPQGATGPTGPTGPSLAIQGTGTNGTFLMNHPAGSNTVYSSGIIQQRGNEIWVGDASLTSMVGNSVSANGRRIVFDNTYNGTAGSGVVANKIVLHNHTGGAGFLSGFGIEGGAVTYHSGGAHNFYNGSNNTSYGTQVMSLGLSSTRLNTAELQAYSDTNLPGHNTTGDKYPFMLRFGNGFSPGIRSYYRNDSYTDSTDLQFLTSNGNSPDHLRMIIRGQAGGGRIEHLTDTYLWRDIGYSTNNESPAIYIGASNINPGNHGTPYRYKLYTQNIAGGGGSSLKIAVMTAAANDYTHGATTDVVTIRPGGMTIHQEMYFQNSRSLYAKNAAGTDEIVMHPRWSDNIMYINYGSGGFNIRNNSAISRMFITDAGNIGIGTTSPSWPIHITRTVATNGTTGIGGYSTVWSAVGQSQTAAAESYGIVVESSDGLTARSGVKAGFFFASQNTITASDRRIKTDIHDISDGEALETLRKIEPANYKYIDTLSRTSTEVFGFIAQQVRENLPQAVQLTREFIPNVYAAKDVQYHMDGSSTLCTIQDISAEVIATCVSGQLIRLFDASDNKYDLPIYSIDSSNSLTVVMPADKPRFNMDLALKRVFVYGVEVSDFHALNKDYLFTVNFAATQEIDRVVQRQAAEIDSLKQTVAAQEAQISDLQAKLSAVMQHLGI